MTQVPEGGDLERQLQEITILHHLYQPHQLALIVANPRQPVLRVARERPQPGGTLASALDAFRLLTSSVSLSAVLKVRLAQSACARCVGDSGEGLL